MVADELPSMLESLEPALDAGSMVIGPGECLTYPLFCMRIDILRNSECPSHSVVG